MSRFEKVRRQKPEEFLREVGIRLETFMLLLRKIREYLQEAQEKYPVKKRGRKSSVCLEDRLLLALYYLRHYETFSRLGGQFGIHESYACKIYHQMLNVLLKVLGMKGRKELLTSELDTILIDVTEQPIERPSKRQRAYYSGKKKCHTIKVQLVVCLRTLQICAVRCKKGRLHDFRILKESKLKIPPEIKKIGDCGYQGLEKLYENSYTPVKKSKNRPLTTEAKKYNRALSRLRIHIEHVTRRCKIFRITKEVYRGKHKNYGKTWNVIAALVNLRYAA